MFHTEWIGNVLGEEDLSQHYGEFRHYHVEKVAYNSSRGETDKMDVRAFSFLKEEMSFENSLYIS